MNGKKFYGPRTHISIVIVSHTWSTFRTSLSHGSLCLMFYTKRKENKNLENISFPNLKTNGITS